MPIEKLYLDSPCTCGFFNILKVIVDNKYNNKQIVFINISFGAAS